MSDKNITIEDDFLLAIATAQILAAYNFSTPKIVLLDKAPFLGRLHFSDGKIELARVYFDGMFTIPRTDDQIIATLAHELGHMIHIYENYPHYQSCTFREKEDIADNYKNMILKIMRQSR